jgi:hypothetical protein
MTPRPSFPKPSAVPRRFLAHLFLLLSILLSTVSPCSSSEEGLIIDPLSSGRPLSSDRVGGPLSITSTAPPRSDLELPHLELPRLELPRLELPHIEPHRELIRGFGNVTGDVTLLVVRIIGKDRFGRVKETSMSNLELYDSIFVKEASLKWQYDKCSAGKLSMNPTDKGVLNVRVNMDMEGADTELVIRAVEAEGIKLLTGVTGFRDYADLTMFVVPQGTKSRGDPGWTGYAIVNGRGSVMNDSKANYLSVQMHETGHNFGLNHAGQASNAFGDLTSHMSRALLDKDFPIKCYNAQNHWAFGWFNDRSITIDPSVRVKIKLLGFVDYKKADRGTEYVIAKIGENHYLQFNRAKLHNIDTEEAADQLVIIEDLGGRNGTSLVAALDDGNNIYIEANFENSRSPLNVQVCKTVTGDTDQDIDWMEVSIGYGSTDCDARLTRDTVQPTPQPSPQPTQKPSPAPSPKPSPRPSPKPSPRPSPKPSPRPSPRPSPLPSPRPSPQPTLIPTSGFQLDETPQPSPQPSSELFARIAGRGNSRGEQLWGANPPSRVAGRIQNAQLDANDESGAVTLNESGAATLNSLVAYTMVAVATAAALLW